MLHCVIIIITIVITQLRETYRGIGKSATKNGNQSSLFTRRMVTPNKESPFVGMEKLIHIWMFNLRFKLSGGAAAAEDLVRCRFENGWNVFRYLNV